MAFFAVSLETVLTRHPRNQDNIFDIVSQQLASLNGNDWGQCGDVAFFVQGAYRDAEGSVKTFQYVFFRRPGFICLIY
jgi:hypothetical protein